MIKTVDEFIELFEGIAEKVTLTIKETIMKKDTDPASTETTPDETNTDETAQDETAPEENVETFRNRIAFPVYPAPAIF